MSVSHNKVTNYDRTFLVAFKSNPCGKAMNHDKSQLQRSDGREQDCQGASQYNKKVLKQSKRFPQTAVFSFKSKIEQVLENTYWVPHNGDVCTFLRNSRLQSSERLSGVLAHKYLRGDREKQPKLVYV